MVLNHILGRCETLSVPFGGGVLRQRRLVRLGVIAVAEVASGDPLLLVRKAAAVEAQEGFVFLSFPRGKLGLKRNSLLLAITHWPKINYSKLIISSLRASIVNN